MKHVIFMAWRYLRFYWGKTAVLVASISLILFVPAGLNVLVEQGAEVLTARAEATPLLIGAKGSAVDLTLSALYFRLPHVEPMVHREVIQAERVDKLKKIKGNEHLEEFLGALLDGDTEKENNIKTQNKEIKDLPISDFSEITTPEDLKDAIPNELL